MEPTQENRAPQAPPPDQKKKPDLVPSSKLSPRGLFVWFAIIGLMLMTYQYYQRDQQPTAELSYNPDFVKLVESGEIPECEIVSEISGNQYIQGTQKSIDSRTGKRKQFRVDVMVTDDLPKWLREHSVTFKFRRESPYFWQIVSSALPILLLLGLLWFMFSRQMKGMGQGALSFGKSRAKMMARDKNKVTFKDVAGVEEAKEEVQEIIDFLKDPKRFQKLGGRIPKGVLLMGPPGTGKTLMAKAIAGEAGVPFFNISGSDFVEMFVGVGASRVRDMFEQGKRNAPCIIFIDEIDAVGRSRFSGVGGGHDEREQTLNALLVEMDGFDTQEGVIIIAATNRPDVLDPALQRPGRFDRQIVIDLPTLDGREAILNIHARGIKLTTAVDLRRIARGTPGFSGADLANLMNEAALLAARSGKESVDLSDLEEARDKVRWGRERRSRVLDEKEKKVTAYHETGHALVTLLVEESEPIHKITIIPRGNAYLGATMQLPEKDRYMEGKRKLKGILATMMGGRVAEELIFGDITSGARSDLKQATRLARLMVCDWGMSDNMGPQTFGNHEELMFLGRGISSSQDFSEDTSRKIDADVSLLLREAYSRAKDILDKNRDKLEFIAQALLERETLDARDVEELMKFGRVLAHAEHEPVSLPATDSKTPAPEAKITEG
ncbi:MAG: ATP-dependent zinc metalloprotease FtsH [bacterium]